MKLYICPYIIIQAFIQTKRQSVGLNIQNYLKQNIVTLISVLQIKVIYTGISLKVMVANAKQLKWAERTLRKEAEQLK